ncbi:Transcriptional regulator, LysR family [Cupriavidus necator H850]|uniref:LysR family transcriptional regulator n=1 Tax=Cupriavidus necator TaxID=106590 RepID=UPI00129E8C10|nr:LysR family transcriptional regulator [Cupriavidus necator]KAI3600663.1 Transcriptional regulator, LysR family [Cupriavidus necator H850]
MKLDMLNTLTAVVESGSFAAAAERVSLTPSAVSLQIKQVEQYFGHPLFDRSGASVTPTPFGLETAAVVKEAMKAIEAMRSRRSPGIEGILRLGLIPSALVSAAPAALQKLRQQYPGLDIRLTSAPSAALLNDLRGGRIDAALLVRPLSGGSSRLHWRDLARDVFVLLAPHGSAARTPAEALAMHGWIRYHRGITGGRIAADFVRQIAPNAKAVAEIESTDAIVAMVSGGMGATVIPQPRQQLRAAYPLREMNLGKQAPWRQLAFCRMENGQGARAFDAVVRVFEDAYARVR